MFPARTCAMNPQDLSQRDGRTVADLPTLVEEINHQELTKTLERPLESSGLILRLNHWLFRNLFPFELGHQFRVVIGTLSVEREIIRSVRAVLIFRVFLLQSVRDRSAGHLHIGAASANREIDDLNFAGTCSGILLVLPLQLIQLSLAEARLVYRRLHGGTMGGSDGSWSLDAVSPKS